MAQHIKAQCTIPQHYHLMSGDLPAGSFNSVFQRKAGGKLCIQPACKGYRLGIQDGALVAHHRPGQPSFQQCLGH